MRHLINRKNVALLWTRPMSPNYDFSVLAANVAVDQSVVGNKSVGAGGTYLAPLYEYGTRSSDLFDDPTGSTARAKRRPNLASAFVEALEARLGWSFVADGCGDGRSTVGPEDAFRYGYAVFHSPSYRSRYSQFLKRDLPRLPLTGNVGLFRALARLGGELVALHLLEAAKLDHPITEYLGGRTPEVEKVAWSNNTVWLDKAQTTGFRGVGDDVWNFHIGGYQVCERWLKDRRGRTLSKDDITHYQKVAVAITETIRLMKEIDEVIQQHGGWPGAFQTGPGAEGIAGPRGLGTPGVR